MLLNPKITSKHLHLNSESTVRAFIGTVSVEDMRSRLNVSMSLPLMIYVPIEGIQWSVRNILELKVAPAVNVLKKNFMP